MGVKHVQIASGSWQFFASFLFVLLIFCGGRVDTTKSMTSPGMCQVDIRQGMQLSDIKSPSAIIGDNKEVQSIDDCVNFCCGAAVTGGCNAISFYGGTRHRCILLHCDEKFHGCVWKKSASQAAVIARIRAPKAAGQHNSDRLPATDKSPGFMDSLWQFYQDHINPSSSSLNDTSLLSVTTVANSNHSSNRTKSNSSINNTVTRTTTPPLTTTKPTPQSTTTTAAHISSQIPAPPSTANITDAGLRKVGNRGREGWRSSSPADKLSNIRHRFGGSNGHADQRTVPKKNADGRPSNVNNDYEQFDPFSDDDVADVFRDDEDLADRNEFDDDVDDEIISRRKGGKVFEKIATTKTATTTTVTTTSAPTTTPPTTTNKPSSPQPNAISAFGSLSASGAHHHKINPPVANGRPGVNPVHVVVGVSGVGAGRQLTPRQQYTPLSTPFLVGICACLGIGVLILLAVFWKVAVNEDASDGFSSMLSRRAEQRYTPLRDDYDGRSESPSLTQTLLGPGRKL